MDNSINQYAIGELLDGRYFYIPSYQRGYRWTEKQVGDLLRDLLCFANDFANEGKEKNRISFIVFSQSSPVQSQMRISLNLCLELNTMKVF